MSDMFKPVDTSLPMKQGFWARFKAFWLQDAEEFLNQDIKVELTPKQQKMENEINEFLYQQITWQKIHDFLFQEVTFGKKKKEQPQPDIQQNNEQE